MYEIFTKGDIKAQEQEVLQLESGIQIKVFVCIDSSVWRGEVKKERVLLHAHIRCVMKFIILQCMLVTISLAFLNNCYILGVN